MSKILKFFVFGVLIFVIAALGRTLYYRSGLARPSDQVQAESRASSSEADQDSTSKGDQDSMEKGNPSHSESGSDAPRPQKKRVIQDRAPKRSNPYMDEEDRRLTATARPTRKSRQNAAPSSPDTAQATSYDLKRIQRIRDVYAKAYQLLEE